MKGRITSKEHYQQNSLLFFTLAFIWIISALSGAAKHPNVSILVFLTGMTLLKPIYRLTCKSAGIEYPKQESALELLITCLTIGLPIGVMVIFFAFINNMNLFFPSFGILLAVVFAVSAYNSRSGIFWLIAPALAFVSVYDLIWHQESFMMGALLAGILLATFGFLSAITGEIKGRIIVYKESTSKVRTRIQESFSGKSS